MPAVDEMLRATARAESRHFWFKGFKHFITPLLIEAARGRTNLRILDCACGTGANLEHLARFGRVYGFDLNEVGLRFGRDGGRTGLARANVGAIPFPDSCFDIVTSFDVLYALAERVERDAVAEMFRVLRPGGAAIFNVAAMEVLTGNHSVLVHQLRRYSRPRLTSLLTGAGFQVVRLTHTNATLFPAIFTLRTFQRLRGLNEAESNGDFSVPPEPVNSILAAALQLEAYLVRYVDLPFGSSLLCLATKPA
jgi:ubiquinone/menaquinone biosynthesis C-methylase UbiE